MTMNVHYTERVMEGVFSIALANSSIHLKLFQNDYLLSVYHIQSNRLIPGANETN